MGLSDPCLPDTGHSEFHAREIYDFHAPPGLGLSLSSTRAVLDSAVYLYRLKNDIDKTAVIQEALTRERQRAGGRAIAADDVIPIVHGGVGELHTGRDGHFEWVPIQHDSDWFRRHLLFAYCPTGTRHDIPHLLEDLFHHKRAKEYVQQISQLATEASFAVQQSDIRKLANSVNRYVTTFDEWMGGRLVNPDVKQMVSKLEAQLGNGLCGWKPPGGGAASSLLVLVEGKRAMTTAIDVLRNDGWHHQSISVAHGMEVIGGGNGGLTIRAPHRLDLVGAADLGQDASIQTDGICCSMAITPYSQWQGDAGHSEPLHVNPNS